MLPKIHKKVKHPAQVFIGRPIISSVSSPLNRIAQFLDFYLLPEVMKSPAYLKDTAHTIRTIESLSLPDNVLLATIDVVGMFTAVPQEEALEIAMKTLASIIPSSCDPPRPSLAFMSKLIKLVLYRNSFEFNNEFFLQISGCPMGLRSSPSLCCLVVNKLVDMIMHLDEKVISFHIYMDDCLLFWNGSQTELDAFIANINDIHPTLHFTHTSSPQEIQFLDLIIFKGDRFRLSNTLDVSCFTKPTETFCYLDRSSCHNPAVFKGFIKGELIRYARNSNNLESFENKKSVFTNKLVDRGYTISEINQAASEVDFQDRFKFIEEKTKDSQIPLVFKMNYLPHIQHSHVRNALLKHWDIILDQPDLNRIFPDVPIQCYSRTKNIRDMLVKAGLCNLESDEKFHDTTDPRKGSQTLHLLKDLEMESRGLDEFFPSLLFQNEDSSSEGDISQGD